MASDLEREFLTRFIQLAPDYPQPIAEYKFHTERHWRFDYAFWAQKVAVELEGIGSKKSRHTSYNGYSADCEKYNQAVLLGWKVLRFTGAMLRDDPHTCIEQVKRLLESWNE